MTVDEPTRRRLLGLVRDIPDWPGPGVVFKDITPLLADAEAFATAVEALAAPGRGEAGRTRVDAVVGIEARGFILAAPVAHVLGTGFVPVRKHGKLPHDTHAVLATGGTVEATAGLVARAGATVTAVSLLIELGLLGGRSRLAGLDVASVLRL